MAAAVVPVHGHGDQYQSGGLARDARVSHALLLQAPTTNRPGGCNPTRIRSSIGLEKPAAARFPDTTSGANGIPTGAKAPSMTLSWGRVGAS